MPQGQPRTAPHLQRLATRADRLYPGHKCPWLTAPAALQTLPTRRTKRQHERVWNTRASPSTVPPPERIIPLDDKYPSPGCQTLAGAADIRRGNDGACNNPRRLLGRITRRLRSPFSAIVHRARHSRLTRFLLPCEKYNVVLAVLIHPDTSCSWPGSPAGSPHRQHRGKKISPRCCPMTIALYAPLAATNLAGTISGSLGFLHRRKCFARPLAVVIAT